ncbi:hypothetical protein F511_43060 [Dorcoceras hygrometricum]|uniref:Uncharacterized protein n=1 Tax=Dorcoceras hygrometricum TaxID=472368 RepID=A0A2Z7BXQ1_9LAMI|nr:hypothetical protein F511_43060 [Dorcoceras hygrometricum]
MSTSWSAKGTMTSAVMSSQSAASYSTTSRCTSLKGNQQVATVHPDKNYSSLYTQTQATVIQSQELQDQRLDNQLQAHLDHQLVNQSLAHLDHQLMYPVTGYSVLHIQSTGNPDAGKADVMKSCKPDADSYNQTQRIQTSNVEDDKKPARERTQGQLPVGTLQNIFQTGRICVQRIESEQRLFKGEDLKEEDDDCANIQKQREEHRRTKQSTTIREEHTTSVDC